MLLLFFESIGKTRKQIPLVFTDFRAVYFSGAQPPAFCDATVNPEYSKRRIQSAKLGCTFGTETTT